jgi:hypothetical protein
VYGSRGKLQRVARVESIVGDVIRLDDGTIWSSRTGNPLDSPRQAKLSRLTDEVLLAAERRAKHQQLRTLLQLLLEHPVQPEVMQKAIDILRAALYSKIDGLDKILQAAGAELVYLQGDG